MSQIRDGLVIVTNGSQVVRQALLAQVSPIHSVALQGVEETAPDVFADGERGHYAPDGGKASSAAASTLVDTTKAWAANEWDGYDVWVVGGTGAGQVREVASNTADTLTVASAWSTPPDATSIYVLLGKGTASGGGALLLNDATRTWAVNQFNGQYVTITGGTGVGQTRLVSSTLSNQLIVSSAWTTPPDATSEYLISKAVAEVLAHEVAVGNAHVDPLDGAGSVGDFLVGETTGGGGPVVSLDYEAQWQTDGVLPDHLFAKNEGEGRSDDLVSYFVGSVDSESQVTLTANYAGPTRKGIGYLLHTSLDPDLGIPLPEAGDVAIRAIVRAGMLKVIAAFKNLASGGAPFAGNAYRSPRVNAGETAYEMVEHVPADASRPFTGVPTLPATNPTLDNHAARKAYVDAQDALALAKTGGEVTGAITLPREILLGPLTADSGGVDTLTDSAAFAGVDYTGLTVEITGGTGAGQTRTIQSNTDDVLTVDTNWATQPDATSVYRIYDAAEDREAAKKQYVDDQVALALGSTVNQLAVRETSNRTIATSGVDQDLVDLTARAIPGADGSTEFNLDAHVAFLCEASRAGDILEVKVWVGSNGDSSDPTVLVADSVEVVSAAAQYLYVDISGYRFTPAAGAKIGVSVQSSGGTTHSVRGDTDTNGRRTWVTVHEVITSA